MKFSRNNIRLPQESSMPNKSVFSLSSVSSLRDLQNPKGESSKRAVLYQQNLNNNMTTTNPNYTLASQETEQIYNDQQSELNQLRLDNEQYKEKVKELERWLCLLLHNFYQGNPQTHKNLEQVRNIEAMAALTIDDLRIEKFTVKKTLLSERKKFKDLQAQYLDLRKQALNKDEEMRRHSQAGELIVQKQALEQTLKTLSEEVELLSQNNQRLLNDLRQKEFYNQYNQAQSEVRMLYLRQFFQLEALREAHYILINTIQSQSLSPSFHIKDSRLKSNPYQSQSFNNSSVFCGSMSGQPQVEISNPLLNERQPNDGSFFSFLSCGGCSPSFAQVSLSDNRKKQINCKDQDSAVHDEIEAVLRKENINFLVPNSARAPKERIKLEQISEESTPMYNEKNCFEKARGYSSVTSSEPANRQSHKDLL